MIVISFFASFAVPPLSPIGAPIRGTQFLSFVAGLVIGFVAVSKHVIAMFIIT